MFRAELLKLRSTRAPWILVAVAIGGMAFMQAISLVIALVPQIAEELKAQTGVDGLLDAATIGFQRSIVDLFGQGAGGASSMSIVVVCVLLLGVFAGTTDFHTGGIVPTALVVPGRMRILAAKAGAVATVVVVLAVALMVVTAISLMVTAGIADVAVVIPPFEMLSVWARGTVVLTLLALLGLGVGMLIRHQVTAMAILAVWTVALSAAGAFAFQRRDLA